MTLILNVLTCVSRVLRMASCYKMCDEVVKMAKYVHDVRMRSGIEYSER